jgi:hypothetical protein
VTWLRRDLAALVIAGALPLVLASYQFLLIGFRFRRLRYGQRGPVFRAPPS